MRHALLNRDVGLLFRVLNRRGVSQRHIGQLTGQSQSEISEILTGRRVAAYEVLERICVGLMIPAGHMGMAYDADTIQLLGPTHPQWRPAESSPIGSPSSSPASQPNGRIFPIFQTFSGGQDDLLRSGEAYWVTQMSGCGP
jgi:transcriptional regulator with XRE-family HTH domain